MIRMTNEQTGETASLEAKQGEGRFPNGYYLMLVDRPGFPGEPHELAWRAPYEWEREGWKLVSYA